MTHIIKISYCELFLVERTFEMTDNIQTAITRINEGNVNPVDERLTKLHHIYMGTKVDGKVNNIGLNPLAELLKDMLISKINEVKDYQAGQDLKADIKFFKTLKIASELLEQLTDG